MNYTPTRTRQTQASRQALTLQSDTMPYPARLILDWNPKCDMLESLTPSAYLRDIFKSKLPNWPPGTRRFFGEALVATTIKPAKGYYSSFKWLTSRTFLTTDRSFPKGPMQQFQEAYRNALHEHFARRLPVLQENARALEFQTGIKPVPPDLWLIDRQGNHRFIEVKLPGDRIRDNQIAGLAVIAASLRRGRNISVEVIQLYPDDADPPRDNPAWGTRFDEFVRVIGAQRGLRRREHN